MSEVDPFDGSPDKLSDAVKGEWGVAEREPAMSPSFGVGGALPGIAILSLVDLSPGVYVAT